MQSKLIISNLNQFLKLVAANPGLLDVPPFRPLTAVFQKLKSASSSCSRCVAAAFYEVNKPIFTAAITNLQPSDVMIVKSMLQVKELCFYVVNNGQVSLKCH